MDTLQILVIVWAIFTVGLAAVVSFSMQKCLQRIDERKVVLFVASILMVAFLGEVLFRPIAFLIIPIFLFGWFYLFYEMVLKKPNG